MSIASTRSPVSVCIIVRDDALLQNALACVAPYVEELVVVDTGSTSEFYAQTHTWLKASGVPAYRHVLYTDCNDPETGEIADFSLARTHSFSLASRPWILWMDADDEIVGLELLSAIVRKADQDRRDLRADALFVEFPYEYAFDGFGNSICTIVRERLFAEKARGFRWAYAIHETITPPSNMTWVGSQDDRVVWKHRRPNERGPLSLARNIRLLQKALAVNPSDLRSLYYLGMDAAGLGRIDLAIPALEKYIEKAWWDDERFLAAVRLTHIHLARGADDAAIETVWKAIESREKWAEGYLLLGQIYYARANVPPYDRRRDWERAVFFAELGLSQPPTVSKLNVDPTFRSFEVYTYLVRALWMAGRSEDALAACRTALAARPADPNMKSNLVWLEQDIARRKAHESVETLSRLGAITAENAAAARNAIAVPAEIVAPPSPASAEPAMAQRPGKYDIVFALGDCLETVNPAVLEEKGLGGSETAVIEMARRLAAEGHRVRIYTSAGEEKLYDGVFYGLSSRLPALKDKIDVFVAWRGAHHLDLDVSQNARLRVLWVHDVWAFEATPERLAKADIIFGLSDYHCEFLRSQGYPSEKIVKTANGIDRARFDLPIEEMPERNPWKVIYSSSPDRGLKALLQMWPAIRDRVAGAELHIFYGFDNWDKAASAAVGPDVFSQRTSIAEREALKQQISALADAGVLLRGRVDQKTLAREMLSAGAWLFPTWFAETSCISAMEAQAAGLCVVTTKLAALAETAVDGILVEGDCYSESYQNKFTESATAALLYMAERARSELRAWAFDRFSWDRVRAQWEILFAERLSASPATSVDEAYDEDWRGPRVVLSGAARRVFLSSSASSASPELDAEYGVWIDRTITAMESASSRTRGLLPFVVAPEIPRRGVWLEFGVAFGTTLKMLAQAKGDARLFGFDSFKGLPENWRPGVEYKAGAMACDPPHVEGAELVVGLFEETLRSFSPPGPVTYVHIDCDLYSSTRAVLRAVKPWLAVGAIIEFDEFAGYDGCERHEMRALYEAELEDGLRYRWVAHDLKSRGIIEILADEVRPATSNERRKFDLILTPFGSNNVRMDPKTFPASDTCGGGSKVGFVGLARALGALGKYDVTAWGTFTENREDDIRYRAVENFRGVTLRGGVALAYYDTSPLDAIGSSVFKIACHHTYEPPWHNQVRVDLHTAPAWHVAASLERRFPGRWTVLPNGIDLEALSKIERWPLDSRIIYHTSCDRGLHHLLKAFPVIKAAMPEATLHVVGDVMPYAYQDVSKISHAASRDRILAVREAVEIGLRAGVRFLGSLPREELHKELSQAAVFAYPCDPIAPCETFSISVMECCAIGLPVVLRPADSLGDLYKGVVAMADTLEIFPRVVLTTLRDRNEHTAKIFKKRQKEFAARYTFTAMAERLSALVEDSAPPARKVLPAIDLPLYESAL